MRGRATGVVLPALAVVALLAVVAIAATGSTPHGSGESRTPSERLLDVVFTLYLLAIVAGAALLVYGLTQRDAIRRQVGRYRRGNRLSSLIVLLAAFVVMTYFRARQWRAQPQDPGEEQAFPGRPPGQGTDQGRTVRSYQADISWISVGVVLLLVAAAVTAYVVAERRSRRGSRVPNRDLGEELALALDEALDDLRAERDPRRAIVAAYARMERVLAANGVPRHAYETSHEYLPRVLHDLDLGTDAVERLTRLYTWAKFSQHTVDADMKEEAIEALEQVRDELRAPREQPASVAFEASQGAAP